MLLRASGFRECRTGGSMSDRPSFFLLLRYGCSKMVHRLVIEHSFSMHVHYSSITIFARYNCGLLLVDSGWWLGGCFLMKDWEFDGLLSY